MKKIAILTLYYHNYNYGGILQAYALQKVIEKMGFSSEQISYKLDSGYRDIKHFKLKVRNYVLHLYYFFKDHEWMIKYNTLKKEFDSFATLIPHTRLVTASNISKIVDQFDVFICGSDQIWNPIGWQPTLFLNFVPNNKVKISYAASIARDKLSKDQYDFIRKYVKDFDAISVREKNSAEMLNQMYPDLNIQDMPDPVFLLDECEWEKIIQRSNNSKPFILAYFLGNENDNREKALEFAKKIGVKIYFVAYLDYSQSKWDKKHAEENTPPLGVKDFLNNIANASLVLTDSFHASLFSAIYRTPFYVMPRFNDGDNISMNSRILNLIEELNLPNRYTNTLSIYYEWSKDELNNITHNLKRLRKKGTDFLKQSILQMDSE